MMAVFLKQNNIFIFSVPLLQWYHGRVMCYHQAYIAARVQAQAASVMVARHNQVDSGHVPC
jgi:hypothetical protein